VTPLRIPRDTPGFDPWRGRTPQPRNLAEWRAICKRIVAALRDWLEARRSGRAP
jgi:hypothetical protein